MRTCLAILLFSALGLRAEIEFSGYFTTSHEALFSLTDLEARRASGWLKIGQSFESYTVMAFDREHEIIALQRGGELLKVPLRASKVKSERATIRGTIKFLNGRAEDVQASLFFGEEASFPLKNGIAFRIKPEVLPDGNILYSAKFVGLDKNGAEQILSAPSVVAIPGKPFGIQIGDMGFSFIP